MVQIRAATPQDVRELRDFLLHAWSQAGPSALGWTGSSEAVIQEIASEEFLQGLVTDPNVELRIADQGTCIVGFALVRVLDSEVRELAGVIVLESETGKEVGKELVRRVQSEARRAGSRAVIVKTEAFNERALGFYRHEGFVETARTEETVHGRKVPLVVLECHPSELAP